MADGKGANAWGWGLKIPIQRGVATLQSVWKRWKPYLSLVILAAIFAFLGRTLFRHWQEVSTLRLGAVSWACLSIATGVTLLAHIWTGWVWGWILQALGQPLGSVWAAQTYLKTNIAKYLPSNLLHLYGRAIAAHGAGTPLAIASLSVLVETLLLVAGGILLGLLCIPQRWLPLTLLGVGSILAALHPKPLGLVLRRLSRSQTEENPVEATAQPWLQHYPLRLLLAGMGFVVLRGLGFVLTLVALTPLPWESVPRLISIFSVGWVLGMITPGAPGGLGVFELTVSALLTQPGFSATASGFSVGVALSAVALYRLVNTLAEGLGAILVRLDERWPLGVR